MKRIFIMFFSLTFLLTACSDDLPIETDMSETVGDFTFTTQDEDELSRDDLEGNWWIADFIFTNCETVCLPMSQHLSKLQTTLDEEGIGINFVSFSVDPDYDTPEVLTEYGKDYGADFDRWTFLTGYDFKTIKELSIKSFRAPLKEPEPGSDQVLHDTRFFLIDPQGEVVKSYDGVNPESLDDILDDLKTLENEGLL